MTFLQDSFPEAVNFFYFLSMLPSGAMPKQLLAMWGPTHEKCSEILSSYGLLETDGRGRRRLTASMACVAEQTISKESMNTLIEKIGEHY